MSTQEFMSVLSDRVRTPAYKAEFMDVERSIAITLGPDDGSAVLLLDGLTDCDELLKLIHWAQRKLRAEGVRA